MKKIFEKLKEKCSTISFKAGLYTTLLTIVILIPVLIVIITLFLQYSIITWQFWALTALSIILADVILCFSSVIYTKLLNNYEEKVISKKEYGKIFVNEILGPLSTSLLIVAFIIYFDQLTKVIAVNTLTSKGSIPFIEGFINFRLAYNKGAAWSMCSEHTDVLAFVSLFASLIMLYFLKDYDLKKKTIYSLAITFILGGTIGNMIDRFFRIDGVVDFIETAFMDFPIFNIADSFLVVGAFLLAISILFFDKPKQVKEEPLDEALVEEEND